MEQNSKQGISEVIKHIIIFIIFVALTFFMIDATRSTVDGMLQNKQYLLFISTIFVGFSTGPIFFLVYWSRIRYPDVGLVESVASKNIPLWVRSVTLLAFVDTACVLFIAVGLVGAFGCAASMGCY